MIQIEENRFLQLIEEEKILAELVTIELKKISLPSTITDTKSRIDENIILSKCIDTSKQPYVIKIVGINLKDL